VRTIAQERRAGAARTGAAARVKGFFRDAWLELQKVIWPSREEVARMTALVIAVVVVVGVFIFVWSRLLEIILRPLLGA
jgi:preprotein translocase SecE subunit